MSYGLLPPEYITGESSPMRLPSVEGINASIGEYASPEAALHGVGSMDQRTIDMLTSTYQKRTGDAFADPFEDMKKRRDAFVMNQALGGASISVGQFGPSILNPASAPAPVQAARPAAPFQPDATSAVPALLQRPDESQPLGPVAAPTTHPLAAFIPPAPSAWMQRDLIGQQLRQAAEKDNANYRLSDATLQLHNAVDPATGKVDANKLRNLVLQRANLSGQNAMLSRITKNNPRILSDPSYLSDSLFTHDAAGKVIPNEDYHPILNDPTFRQEMERSPAEAAALYRAFSNRDLKTDIAAHSQALSEQQKNRQQVIESMGRSVEADPVSGDLYKTITNKDQFGSGEYQLSKAPVTDFEKELIDRGEWQRHYGIDLPGRGGLKAIPGMDKQGLQEYRSAVREYMAKHPNATVAEGSEAVLSDAAHKKLMDSQNPVSDQRSGLVKTGDTVGQFMLHLINRGIIGTPNRKEGLLNPLLRGVNDVFYGIPRSLGADLPRSPQIPLLPVPTDEQLIQSNRNTPNASELLSQADKYLAERGFGQY
jgi:hypothetical protein